MRAVGATDDILEANRLKTLAKITAREGTAEEPKKKKASVKKATVEEPQAIETANAEE